MIDEGTFNQWAIDPVTKALKRYLERQVAREQAAWARGNFEDVDVYKAAKQNAAALGRVEAYSEILRLEFSELEKEDD